MCTEHAIIFYLSNCVAIYDIMWTFTKVYFLSFVVEILLIEDKDLFILHIQFHNWSSINHTRSQGK